MISLAEQVMRSKLIQAKSKNPCNHLWSSKIAWSNSLSSWTKMVSTSRFTRVKILCKLPPLASSHQNSSIRILHTEVALLDQGPALWKGRRKLQVCGTPKFKIPSGARKSTRRASWIPVRTARRWQTTKRAKTRDFQSNRRCSGSNWTTIWLTLWTKTRWSSITRYRKWNQITETITNSKPIQTISPKTRTPDLQSTKSSENQRMSLVR